MSSQSPFGIQGALRRSKTEKVLLPRTFTPTQYSVICGRGKAFSAAPGNQWLRKIVSSHISAYAQSTTKIEKSAIVSMIVSIVKKASPDGGAFVCFKDGRWWEEQEAAAREKVGCYLRDAMPMKYRSSTKAKLERRRAVKSDTSIDGDMSASVDPFNNRMGDMSESSASASGVGKIDRTRFGNVSLRNTSVDQRGEFPKQKLDLPNRPNDQERFSQLSRHYDSGGQSSIKVHGQQVIPDFASLPRSTLPDVLRHSEVMFAPRSSADSFNGTTMPDRVSGVAQSGSPWNSNVQASSALTEQQRRASLGMPLDVSVATPLDTLLLGANKGKGEQRGEEEDLPTILCTDEMLGNLAYGEIANLDDDAISRIFEP